MMVFKHTPKEILNKTLPQKEIKKRLVFFLKLIFFLAIVYVQLRFPNITDDYGIPSNIMDAALFYITAHMIISFSRLFIVYLYIRKAGRQIDYMDNFILGINQIAAILSFLMVIIAMFLLFKINATEFFTSISIVAVAIAVIFKDYISNMINGMIIMFSDQLSLEDYVKIGSHQGKIVNITLLNMHVINDDDDLVYVPNNSILTSDIVNFTKRNIKKITLEFELDQSHLKSYERLKHEFRLVLQPFMKNVKDESPVLKVVKIDKDAIHLKFQFMLIKRNRLMEKEIRKNIHESIISVLSKQE
jgi:small-conductance mechanosensitive channel